MMHIEPFSAKHIDDLAHIERVCFSRPWSRDDLESQLYLDTSHFLVAVVDGRAVGYMGLQIFSGEGYVTNVAVLPEYRKQGIAQALIAEQMKHKMDFITLEVRESNASARSLYTKMGFDYVGIRPNFYSAPDEDAVIMTKYLL